MNRKSFSPAAGTVYRNHGGGSFQCLGTPDQTGAFPMRNTASGWTLQAHGVGIYDDGSIDWDYSTGGHFPEATGSFTIATFQEYFKEFSPDDKIGIVAADKGKRKFYDVTAVGLMTPRETVSPVMLLEVNTEEGEPFDDGSQR